MKQKSIYNIFLKPEIAEVYDDYYQEETGKKIDEIEQKVLSHHLNGIEKRELIELGCGTGHWTWFFCKAGFQVTAIDESESMLKIAEKKRPKNCKLLKADASKLPFPDNSFSVIASVTMLEFVDDVNNVMNEIDRILKPGGSIILGCLNELSELGKSKHKDPVFKYARFFTPEQIQELLKRFGEPYINYGIHFSPNFELLDGTEKQIETTPAFIAASVKKMKNENFS